MKLTDLLANRKALYEPMSAIEFVSGPGLGKSTAIREAAALLSLDYGEPFGFLSRILSGVDAVDVKGFNMPYVDQETKEFRSRFSRPPIFPEAFNIEVFEEGNLVIDPARLQAVGVPGRGIMFLDEFGQADVDIQKVCAELLLSRRINEHRLPAGWGVWAASNRISDKSGVVKRLAFVDNRMATYPVDPDVEGWVRWCLHNGVHPLAVTFGRRNASIVFRDSVPVAGGKFCTPRSLVLCTHALEALRRPGMPESQLPHTGLAVETIEAWMGQGDGAVYAEHISLGARLPEPEQVWNDPQKCPLPEGIDARFVMLINLALVLSRAERHGVTAQRDLVAPTLTYAERFEEDLQISFVVSLTKQAPGVQNSPAFAPWAMRHKDLVMAAHAL